MKYRKVTKMEVLKKIYSEIAEMNRVGCWVDYISIEYLAELLNTSQYQIRKYYRELEKEGYLKKEKRPIYCEDYDNGLYTESIAILFTKVFVLTDETEKLIRKEK